MSEAMKRLVRPVTPAFVRSAWRSIRPHEEEWSERQATLKAAHEQRNRGRPKGTIVLREGIEIKIHKESRLGFEHFCYIDPRVVDELDTFVAHTAACRRLLDVGAWHGLFSLTFTANDPEKSALAVDASPAAFGKLVHNVHLNDAKNITSVQCALSSASGTLAMHQEWEHLVAGEDGGRVVKVAMRTGDELCAAHSFSPDVIKIDVEAHELEVVRGLRETIRTCRPLIFLELHAQWLSNESMENLAQELDALSYTTAETPSDAVATENLATFTGLTRLMLRPRVGSIG